MTTTPLKWQQLLNVYTELHKTAKKIPLRKSEGDMLNSVFCNIFRI